MGSTVTEVSISGNPYYLERVRRVVSCLSEHVGMDSRECYDTKLAVTEACANAIRHGVCESDSDRITIKLSSAAGTLVAEVSDQGKGFDPCAVRPPDIERPGGQGIPLMKALMDEMEFVKDGIGTTVRLVKRARRPRRPRIKNNLR